MEEKSQLGGNKNEGKGQQSQKRAKQRRHWNIFTIFSLDVSAFMEQIGKIIVSNVNIDPEKDHISCDKQNPLSWFIIYSYIHISRFSFDVGFFP